MSQLNLKNIEAAQINLPGIGRVALFFENDTAYVKKDDGTVVALATDVVSFAETEPALPSPYAFWYHDEVFYINDANTEWVAVTGGVTELVNLTDVDTTDIGDDKILVYKEATNEFVFEDKPTGAELDHFEESQDVTKNQWKAKGTGDNYDIELVPKGNGVVRASSKQIKEVADPADNQDAATKKYVDDGQAELETVTLLAANWRYLAHSIEIVAAGTGYQADDELTVTGGTGTEMTIKVLTVDAGGEILTAEILTEGSYTVVPANPVAVTGGNGNDDATFNIVWRIKQTVAVAGVTATSIGILTYGQDVNMNQLVVEADVQVTGQDTDEVEFTCFILPVDDLVVKILLL